MIDKLGIIFLLLSSLVAQADVKEFVSGNQMPILIELYSSEGCSSCPPAERQLGELLNDKNLWQKYVPVNFHVDYWNQLGWVDPYSNKVFTQRQNAYAKYWGARNIYTPAFVNNAESIGPRMDLTRGEGSLEKRPRPKVKVAIENKKSIKVNCENLEKNKKYEVHFAYLGNGLISNVNAGENQGEKLTQNFTVLEYKIFELKNNEIAFKLENKKTTAQPKSYSFAAWVTEAGAFKPIQVLGGHL